MTFLPIECGDCKATCEKAGQTALDLSTAGAAACRVTIAADGGDNSTDVFFGALLGGMGRSTRVAQRSAL